MKKFKWIARSITAAVLVIFLVFGPTYLRAVLQHNFYREWMEGEPEDWSGVLSLWHVVEFKTYQGSITAWLESVAAQMEKQHGGIYLEVVGLTPESLQERFARGERPDIWSFASGALAEDTFCALSADFEMPTFRGNMLPLEKEGGILAVPYLYSGYYLLGNTVLLQEWGMQFPDQSVQESMRAGDYTALSGLLRDAMAAKATARHGGLCAPPLVAARLGLSGKFANEGDFKAGQVPFMIGDARACGDLMRKMASGGFTFESIPLGGFTEQVQYIGMDAGCTGKRTEYAERFISMLLTEQAQGKLTSLGALPAAQYAEAPQYIDTGLQKFYEAYAMPIVPMPALYHEKKEQLLLEAARAAEGNENSFAELLREVVQNG